MKKYYCSPLVEAVSVIATNSLLDTSVLDGVSYSPVPGTEEPGGISVGGN